MTLTDTINSHLMSINDLKKVIVVTGTPAVGKTTISRLLASKLNARYIDVTELVTREKLYDELDAKRKVWIANIKKVTQRVHEITRKSRRDLIIEGHYAASVVAHNTLRLAFVLRRDPEDLKIELEKRGYAGQKLWENLAAEILDVCLWEAISNFGTAKVCEINVSGKEPMVSVKTMMSTLNEGGLCRVGVVDWLGELEKRGKLQDFLDHF